MDCPGFVRVNGAVIAPGVVIKQVDVPDGHLQNITLRVLKVRVPSFILYKLALFEGSSFLIKSYDMDDRTSVFLI